MSSSTSYRLSTAIALIESIGVLCIVALTIILIVDLQPLSTYSLIALFLCGLAVIVLGRRDAFFMLAKKRSSRRLVALLSYYLGIVVVCAEVPAFLILPPLFRQDCGAIRSNGDFSTGDEDGMDCFKRAYQENRAASLSYEDIGVDTDYHYNFTLQPHQGKDSITLSVHATVNGHSNIIPDSVTCADLKQTYAELLIYGCRNYGSITIRPIVNAQYIFGTDASGHFMTVGNCGAWQRNLDVTYPLAATGIDAPGECVLSHRQLCEDSTLTYITPMPAQITVDTITLAASGAGAACHVTITDTHQQSGNSPSSSVSDTYSCDAITQQSDNAAVISCGVNGTITIMPPAVGVSNSTTFPTPPLIGTNCGQQVLTDCISQAYSHCSAATVMTHFFIQPSTTITHTITTVPASGGCALDIAIQFGFSADLYHSNLPIAPFQTARCTGMQMNDGVLVAKSCGDLGDLVYVTY